MLHYLFVSSRPSLAMTFWIFPLVYFAVALVIAYPAERFLSHTLSFELSFYIYLFAVFTWIIRVWTQSANCSTRFFRFLAKTVAFCVLSVHIHMLILVQDLMLQDKIAFGNFEAFEEQFFKAIEKANQKKKPAPQPVTHNPMRTAAIEKLLR